MEGCGTVTGFFSESEVRISRQGLEDLLSGTKHKKNRTETTNQFLTKIMAETRTNISWASINGLDEDSLVISGDVYSVFKAKEKIFQLINNTESRITMKMDVEYPEHSHIIGKGGRIVKKIMEITNSRVHFPDINRTSENKSNTVSITGSSLAIEKARAMIRENCPLVITFEIPHTVLQPINDPNAIELALLQAAFDFTITVKEHAAWPTTVSVRCNQAQFQHQRYGILFVMIYFCGKKVCELPVSIKLEVLYPQYEFITRRCEADLRIIMQKTGTRINYFNKNTRNATYVIRGTIDGTYLAWRELMGLLPLTITFDVHEEQHVDVAQVNRLLTRQLIDIKVRPKPRNRMKTIIITGAEKLSKLLLQTRQQILHLEELEFPIDDKQTDVVSFLLSQSGVQNYGALISDSFNNMLLSVEKDDSLYNFSDSSPDEDSLKSFDSSNGFTKEIGPVGCERKHKQLQQKNSPDYELKKILATKAMQRSIDSEDEAQVPSSLWAGYGFSQSSPAAIRQHFKAYKSQDPCRDCESCNSAAATKLCNNNCVNDIPENCANSNCKREANFSCSNYFEECLPKLLPTSEVNDLPQLLCKCGLQSYIDTFMQHEIDFEVFLSMTEQDLHDLGIPYGPRRKMLCTISEIKQQVLAFMKNSSFERQL